MNLKPLGDRIVVQRQEAGEKTKGGIILPDSAKEKPQMGSILAVGDGKILKDGKRQPLQLKKGDTVLFTSYAGDEFKLDTRGGADVVNIERGNFFGGSVIKKLATIQLGIGDDQLLIGNPLPAVVAPFPDHTRVNFLGGLNADGGVGGSDNRNDIVGENDGVLIAGLIGFELSTLV